MESSVIENLILFGLTRQEAAIYLELLKHGDLTGYELSKQTGISRSNIYSSLAGLAEKGAACLIEGEATRYTAVSMKDFVYNTISDLNEKAEFLIKHAPKKIEQSTGYITIQGDKNIRHKIRQMLTQTEFRVYIMADSILIKDYTDELKALIAAEKKVVILCDDCDFDNAIYYKTEVPSGQIRLITDSAFVLTGEITGDEHDTCLYSGQKNLVEVMKESLKNKITLLGK